MSPGVQNMTAPCLFVFGYSYRILLLIFPVALLCRHLLAPRLGQTDDTRNLLSRNSAMLAANSHHCGGRLQSIRMDLITTSIMPIALSAFVATFAADSLRSGHEYMGVNPCLSTISYHAAHPSCHSPALSRCITETILYPLLWKA